MLYCIGKTFSRQLTHVTRPVPDLTEKRMPRRDVYLMKDLCSPSAVVLLDEVRAIPTGSGV